MNLIYGTAFYVLQILFLRGLLISYKKLKKIKFNVDSFSIFGLSIYIFSPIISFFILGNLTLFLNFFFSLNTLQPYFFILFISTVLMNLYEKINLDINKKDLSILYFFIP